MKVTVRSRSSAPIGCLALFFGLFALAGSGLLWVMAIQPLVKSFAARSWVAVSAVVTESTVERHSGSKGGSTYSVKISYDYEYPRGQKRHGSRYDFQTGASSGIEAKQAVVDRFPVGASTTCWVNPADPSEAVIDRSVGWWVMWGCFALVFLGAGLGGLVYVIATAAGRRKARALAVPGGSISPG